MGTSWYVREGSEEFGPFSLAEMGTYLRNKRVLPKTLVRAESELDWHSADSIEDLRQILLLGEWFFLEGELVFGPFYSVDTKGLCQQGKILSTTFIRRGAGGEWIRAGKVDWLADALASRPQAVFQAASNAIANHKLDDASRYLKEYLANELSTDRDKARLLLAQVELADSEAYAAQLLKTMSDGKLASFNPAVAVFKLEKISDPYLLEAFRATVKRCLPKVVAEREAARQRAEAEQLAAEEQRRKEELQRAEQERLAAEREREAQRIAAEKERRQSDWYIFDQRDGIEGPMATALLRARVDSGTIRPNTGLRNGANGKWMPASAVQGLFAATETPSSPVSASEDGFRLMPCVDCGCPVSVGAVSCPKCGCRCIQVPGHEKYPALRFIAGVSKFFAVLTPILCFFGLIFVGQSNMPEKAQAVVSLVIYMILSTLFLWGTAELILLLIDIEKNTRGPSVESEMAAATRRENNEPPELFL